VNSIINQDITRFGIQLELSFDQIDNSTQSSLKNFYKELNNSGFFNEWAEKEYSNLFIVSDILKKIATCIKNEKKINTNDFQFFTNMSIFNNILNLNLFDKENKNTKKSICVFLLSLFKTLQLRKDSFENELTEEETLELYNQCLKTPTPQKQVKKVQSSSRSSTPNVAPTFPGGGQLQSLMTEMMQDLTSGKMDPKELLQEFMKGPENFQNSPKMKDFTKKFESRMENPEFKQEMESISKNISSFSPM
jgi:hypothetical protein